MNKLLVICGSTATGKTDLGIFLARKFNGEIISADSRQVYTGMDIGTGKDLPASSKFIDHSSQYEIENKKLKIGYREKEDIPIWLVDVVEPDYPFNVGEYAWAGLQVISYLHKQNILPIIVGGTGLYVNALTKNLTDVFIPGNTRLREELEKLNTYELQIKLKQVDTQKLHQLNQSDRGNPRRLIRALEISIWKQSHPEDLKQGSTLKDALFIGLTAPKTELLKRIKVRIQERVNQGMQEEIQSLLKKGYSWDLQSFSATGYREWQRYFELRITNYELWKKSHVKLLEQAIQQWQKHEEQYAKRQLTWFKKDARIHWFDITDKEYKPAVEQLVASWYT